MATDLPGTPTTEWQRTTPGAAVSDNLLSQITAQAAAAAAAAAQAAADAAAALQEATDADTSSDNAEAAALAAAAAASVAQTNALAAAASAAAAAAAAAAAEAALAGQVKVSKDGGVQTVVQVLDLHDGLTMDITGLVAQLRTPINRDDIDISPGAMEEFDIVNGTIALGAYSALRRITSTNRVWVRFYATAADRTADASRAIDENPTTDLLADIILDTGLTEEFNPVLLMNGDDPRGDDIYFAIMLLDATGGTGVNVGDTPPVTGSTHSPLSAQSPSTPASTGWTAYEYKGTAGNFLVDEFGEIVALNSGAAFQPLRTNVDITDDDFDFTIDLFRFAVDGSIDSAGACFHVPDTAIGAYDNFNYHRVIVVRASSNTVDVKLQHVDFDGTISDVAGGSSSGVSMNTNSGLRFRINVNGMHVQVYKSVYGTGASETLLFETDLTIDHRDGHHRRLGVMAIRSLSSTGINIRRWFITSNAADDISPVVTVRRTRFEEAAL